MKVKDMLECCRDNNLTIDEEISVMYSNDIDDDLSEGIIALLNHFDRRD